MKNATIIVLLAAVILIADRAVRLENQRYALLLHMCEVSLVQGATVQRWDFDCLEKTETRISWFAQLFYVLTDPAPAVAPLVGGKRQAKIDSLEEI